MDICLAMFVTHRCSFDCKVALITGLFVLGSSHIFLCRPAQISLHQPHHSLELEPQLIIWFHRKRHPLAKLSHLRV